MDASSEAENAAEHDIKTAVDTAYKAEASTKKVSDIFACVKTK